MDHALRYGDSLVGLTRRQIEALHWDVQLRHLWDDARHELAKARLYGDLVLSAFFEESKAKQRETKRSVYANEIVSEEADQHRSRLDEARHAHPPLAPFHWDVEFPEVFERQNLGFDAFVGNPPFGGKNTVASANVSHYPDWLKELHEASHGNADIVAHFYRRVFNLLRSGGAFGLIATNTIAQGDTRATGLRWICQHGGEIYRARKRVKWPGLAAVVVSVLHVRKDAREGRKLLDDREVKTITAFLFHRGGHDDPARLASNAGKSFQGSIVLGMGFTFDDTDTKGVATPIAEMERLIDENPDNREVIFPYIGGAEVNTSPTHAHHRYVINFGDRSEQESRRRWPELMAMVEEKVKPERLRNNRKGYRRYWWQHGEKRVDLFDAVAGLERVLAVNCEATPHMSFALLSSRMVFANTLAVIAHETHSAFCGLQSRPHEIWARFFGSSMKDDLRYTPSDCFETFPFPENWASHPGLESAGQAYYDFRADLMVEIDEGLTQTYNRFHDPADRSPGILRLRELHTEIDRAVLAAYGWDDIPTDCEFLLDYEIDDEEWNPRRRKPWRYRWPDDIHDEVLARLLELNAERAAEEARAGIDSRVQAKGSSPTERGQDRLGMADLFS